MRMKWLMLACLVMSVLVAIGCAPAKAPAPKAEVPAGYESIRLVGSSLGSDSTTGAMALAAVFNKHLPEIEWSSCSGDTGTNPIFLTKGTSKLGMALPSGYIQAFGYDKIPESRLRSISHPSGTVQYLFAIPEDKPWTDITQVPKGSSVVIGGAGTTPLCCDTWLEVCGLSKKDFKVAAASKNEMADAWRGGKTDVAFMTVEGMYPALMDMYISPRKFKPMGMSPEQLAKAKAEQAFERRGWAVSRSNVTEVAGEVFKYDVVCPQAPKFLACRDDFPADLAYRMAKVLDEQRAEVVQVYHALRLGTPQWHIQWAKPPLDIHPGVAKYYREKGYLK